jgi:arylsulfatase
MARRDLAILGPLLGLSASGCGPGPGPSRAVVLITCDTLRADHLGFQGASADASPNLDALAGESLVFASAWSTLPITGPALSALLTGRMPEDLGLENNRTLLAGEAVTLAERLAASGVSTAAVVSNWVLRRQPELGDAGVQQGFVHFDDTLPTSEAARAHVKERLAHDTTDAALAWLDAHREEEPFFLWVHYQDPHGPYTAPPGFFRAPERTAEAPLAVGDDQTGRGALPAYQVVDDERRPAVYRARYAAEVRYFDHELGRLLLALRARGVLDRALLVFSADHGESLGEHGFYFSHGQNLHRELLQVPLLLRPPGGARNPERIPEPVSHLDLFPTILAHFGLDAGPVRGVDLLAARPPDGRALPQRLRAAAGATGARHRLIVEGGKARLYDLELDPGEERDLAAELPEVVRSLMRARRAFVERVPLAPLAPAEARLDAGDLRTLDALGYGGDGDG